MKAMEWLFIIIGLLSIIYGAIVARVGSGTGFFMVWLFIGVAFIAAFVTFHAGLWDKLPAFVKVIVKAISVIVLLSLIIVECIIFQGFTYKAKGDLDYIIVLGAQVRDDGPSMVLKYRLNKAYEYLTDNKSTICIVSGGQGGNEPCAEADAMEAYLKDKGIPGSRIRKEDKSHNTLENMQFSKELTGNSGAAVGIVTNNFHVFRGVAIAKKQGFTDVCGIPAPSTPLYLPNNMLREFFGVVKDKLHGNI